MSVAISAPPTPTSVLRDGLAIADRLTLDGDTSVTIYHNAYQGHHEGEVQVHPRSSEQRRRVMGSRVFAGTCWDFARISPTHVVSMTVVDGVRVAVHGGRL